MTVSCDSHILHELAGRLDDLRGRLDPSVAGTTGDTRKALEALKAEAEGLDFEGLPAALGRLALLTEVWECLAAEETASATELAAFFERVLEHLARSVRAGDTDLDTSWILQESVERWGIYLDLLEPSRCEQSGDIEDLPQLDPPDDSEPPSVDLGGLLRLLTGSSRAPAGEEAQVQGSEEIAESVPYPDSGAAHPRAHVPGERECKSLASLLDSDPELRQAFLIDAADLHERLETLALALERDAGSVDLLTDLRRCLHTLKGTAGSVGLADLASLVHGLEDRLQPNDGVRLAGWADLIRETLDYFDSVMVAIRSGAPVEPASQALHERIEQPAVDVGGNPPIQVRADSGSSKQPGSASGAPHLETLDSSIRVSCECIDGLMDLVSELITRRGMLAAQADSMKQFATTAQLGRQRLVASIDRLRAFTLVRDATNGSISKAPSSLLPPVDGTDLVARLTEQAEDLTALAETARLAVDPLADMADDLSGLSLRLWEALQELRVVPVRGLFHRLARVAREAARVENRSIEVVLVGEEVGVDRSVQERAFEPLLHAVRNAVGHGIEPADERARAKKPAVGRIVLEARREGYTLVLKVQDDGRGLDAAAIATKARHLGLLGACAEPTTEQIHALVFQPGLSTREKAGAIAGRGVGMDVVAREVARLHGTVLLASQPGQGTVLTIRLPARLLLEQAMVVRIEGRPFALPLGSIDMAQQSVSTERDGTGADATLLLLGERVRLLDARRVLDLPPAPPRIRSKVFLLHAEGRSVALLVDAIDGARELVMRPLSPLLAGHPLIAGTSLSLAGELIFVLDPFGLVHCQTDQREAIAKGRDQAMPPSPGKVLVVDDAISVRRVARRQFGALGLETDEAADGVEALRKLRSASYQLILTDLEMPRMDGFELLAELARSGTSAATPVVVVSTRSDAQTERRVLELGAKLLVPKPIGPDTLTEMIVPLLQISLPLDTPALIATV